MAGDQAERGGVEERCPTCGCPVRVVTGGEGTSHYERLGGAGMEAEAAAEARAELRYALLWDLDAEDYAIPVGTVVEQGYNVVVHLPPHYMIPKVQTAVHRKGTPAGGIEEIGPRHPRYFDEVVMDLSRTFAITDPAALHSEGLPEWQRHGKLVGSEPRWEIYVYKDDPTKTWWPWEVGTAHREVELIEVVRPEGLPDGVQLTAEDLHAAADVLADTEAPPGMTAEELERFISESKFLEAEGSPELPMAPLSLAYGIGIGFVAAWASRLRVADG